ncbi:MAG: hypothetical protein IT210_11050 [Armatimonadetes bacterium]|nr:hypothetical protein [Armatimonadota bacterium]
MNRPHPPVFRNRAKWAVSALLVIISTAQADAGHHRFWLASQHDFGAKRGFYLDFENDSEGNAPCRLETLRLILGVGDGRNWQFPSVTPKWKYNRDYSVKAAMTPGGAELWLDGQKVAESRGGFAPYKDVLTAAHIPAWAGGLAEYIIRQKSLKITGGGTGPLAVSFDRDMARPLPLILFEPQAARRLLWQPKAGVAVTVEAVFRLVRSPDLKTLAPLIDRYGQSRHADWPGKIKSDTQLKKTAMEEERRLQSVGFPEGYDRYGGSKRAGWREKGTGFFRLAKRGGYWWLISPEGNPTFYLGVCTAPGLSWEMTPVTGRESLFEWLPPKGGLYGAAWNPTAWGQTGTDYLAFHTVNMIRKYGAEWERKGNASTARRLKTWGFSGIGKWGGAERLSSFPVLWRWDVPNLVRHPDIFDPAALAAFRESIRKQVDSRKDDPFVVGWSLGNEYDEIILKTEIRDILKMGEGVPSKRALVAYALDSIYGSDLARMGQAWGVQVENHQSLYAAQPQPPDADIEKLRLFYADRYYAFIYRTVKEFDPNHLYFGFWIVPGWWENEDDWRVGARHCDTIGYDRYANNFADEQLLRLIRESDKPVLCGEFSFPVWYGGRRGFGLYGTWAGDEAGAARSYTRWVQDAARNPYCIGLMWFQYRDQALTGRGPGGGPNLVYGEHYAFGLLDMTDRPKWQLVNGMQAANLKAVAWRMKAEGE